MRSSLKNQLVLIGTLFLGALIVSATNCMPVETPAVVDTTCDHRYPDYDGNIPPNVDTADLYYLNQDWPEEPVAQAPEITAKLHSFLPITEDNIDSMMLYMRSIIFEQLVPADFSQRQTKWFAVPHMGRREAMHGMYDGNNIDSLVWDPAQKQEAINFTTDLYNEVSAYTIGQVWGDCSRSVDDPKITLETNQFPEGSIVLKLAMTALPVSQAPFLTGAYQWQVYADPNGQTIAEPGQSYNPQMLDVHLIQMDMIIKDSVMAPQTGWLFSTFVYDQHAEPIDMPAGTPAEKEGIYKMIPLGAMWGNDPGVLLPEELKETVLNPHWTTDPPAFITNTLGLNGRLSGPIDDVGNRGSCIQCHSAAEWNVIRGIDDTTSAIFGTLQYPEVNWTDAEKTAWMSNFNGTQSYGNTVVSPEVTRYIADSLGIQIGPDWIGMDLDFVMTAAALNAAHKQGKMSKANILVGKFH